MISIKYDIKLGFVLQKNRHTRYFQNAFLSNKGKNTCRHLAPIVHNLISVEKINLTTSPRKTGMCHCKMKTTQSTVFQNNFVKNMLTEKSQLTTFLWSHTGFLI